MKIMRPSEIPAIEETRPLFTGVIARQTLVADEVGQSFTSAIVNFPVGVRTKLHTHTGDQILIISAGKGIVATEQEESSVLPGDIVFFAAGEKQWHGASKDSDASYMYVLSAGSEVKILKD